MEIYIVGGYCRDKLMGRNPSDKDFVVIGGTTEEMKQKGFILIHGTKFPVFIDPKTNNEYALARKEIKTGSSHQDFKFVFTPDITLEEDLYRRDFTINTLVMNQNKQIIHTSLTDIALSDLDNKIIRMVSKEHFYEDPLRAIRAIRFASVYNFSIEKETEQEIKRIIKSEDFKTIPMERIKSEIKKCFQRNSFQRMFNMFHDFGVWEICCPEIESLWNSPENVKYHPEGNTGGHTANAIKFLDNYFKNFNASDKELLYLGTMFHDIGKPFTDKMEFPKHHDHDSIGLYTLLNSSIKDKFQLNNQKFKFIKLVVKHHMNIWKWFDMKNSTKMDLLLELCNGATEFSDAKNRVKNFLLCCFADHFGKPLNNIDYELVEDSLNTWTDDLMIGFDEIMHTKLTDEQLKRTKTKEKYRSSQLRLNRIERYTKIRKFVENEDRLSKSTEDLKLEQLKKIMSGISC